MIKKEQDAFGQEMIDFYNGEPVHEIVERDDGFIGLSMGPERYFAPFAEWTPSEQELIQYANGRCLDIGCGPGRVCLYLQAQGHGVVGIDNSPLAIETAKLRGVKDARVLAITQASRTKLGVFDTMIMLGNNFGLFGNAKRAKWLLRRFYGMTRENGRILAASNNIYKTDKPEHLAFHQRNCELGRMSGQVRIRVRHRNLIGNWFDYLMVSPEEMAELAAGTGWQIAHLFETEDSPAYTAVLEKI